LLNLSQRHFYENGFFRFFEPLRRIWLKNLQKVIAKMIFTKIFLQKCNVGIKHRRIKLISDPLKSCKNLMEGGDVGATAPEVLQVHQVEILS
jgi:hypothetical protein